MGISYWGPFAEHIDADRHTGYAARILPDGAETGTWTYETRDFTGYRAHCDCGWRGAATYPPTEHGEDLANEVWDYDHLRPLIDAAAQRTTVTGAQMLGLARGLRASLPTAVDEQGKQVLTERGRGVLDAVEALEQLLDELAGSEAL